MATFEVIRSGCASALKIQLQGQAAVFAENDALVSKTQNVEIGASLGNSGGLLGGLLGGAARSFLTNESWSCDFSPSDFLKYFPCHSFLHHVQEWPVEASFSPLWVHLQTL